MSAFEDKFAEEEKKRKLLKMRLEMAKFLQETIEESGIPGSQRAEAVKEFGDFFRKVRTTGEQASTDELIRVAKLFHDELTLDNLSRPQLVSMCRYMNLNAFGTDNFLRYQIRNKMNSIKQDDKVKQTMTICARYFSILRPTWVACEMMPRGMYERSSMPHPLPRVVPHPRSPPSFGSDRRPE